MTRDFIPDDITQFIIEKIDSVAELEALLLLHSTPEEKWSVSALSGRLYINEKETAEVLAHLRMHGLPLTKPASPHSISISRPLLNFNKRWTEWPRYTQNTFCL